MGKLPVSRSRRLKVKLDEDLSSQLVSTFVECGYNASTVVSQGWGGATDASLWPRVRDEGRMFITADKGFGDIRAYPPGRHPGIVLIRAERESVIEYMWLARLLLARHPLETLTGCTVVVTARGIRIRRPGELSSRRT